MRFETERPYDVEPVESAFNPILAAPLFEATEDNSIDKISWSNLDEQLDLLLREEKKRSEAVRRAIEENIDEISRSQLVSCSLAAIKPNNRKLI